MAVGPSKGCDRAMKQLGSLVFRMNMIMTVITYIVQQGPVMAAAEGEREVGEPLKSGLAMIEMKVHNLYHESFDWDAERNRFLVGSTRYGKLVTVTEDGTVEDFVKEKEYAGAMIVGVTVDPVHNRVLAAVNNPINPNRVDGPAVVNNPISPKRIVGLAAYDLDSKKRSFFVNLHQEEDELRDDSARRPKDEVANDVAVDGDGNAYLTNSAGNSIWKVTREGEKSVFIASVPQLPYAVENEFVKTVTTNGIVFHHEGYLLVSQSNSGAMLRVRLADQEVLPVKLTDGANSRAVMPGADGIALRSDGSLVVVSTHTAWLLSSRDSWRSATLIDKVPLDPAVSTTAVTAKNLDVFAIHSHFGENFRGLDWDSFKILEIRFPADDSQDNNPLWLLAVAGIFAGAVLIWKFQINQFNKGYSKKRA